MSDDWIGSIREKDRRYAREAFEFVQESLRCAHAAAGRKGHVTGRELLLAFRELARTQFGPLARTVLASWGVRRTEDVGEIVFLCVAEGSMGKTDDDTMGDFSGVYEFDEAFPEEPGDVAMPRRASAADDEEEDDDVEPAEPDVADDHDDDDDDTDTADDDTADDDTADDD